MAPISEFLCRDCGHIFEEIRAYDPENKPINCPHDCGLKATRIPSAHGGYHIKGNNGASIRPRGAGAFKGRKSD